MTTPGSQNPKRKRSGKISPIGKGVKEIRHGLGLISKHLVDTAVRRTNPFVQKSLRTTVGGLSAVIEEATRLRDQIDAKLNANGSTHSGASNSESRVAS